MIRYFILIVILAFSIVSAADNPHGDINFDCSECHSVESFQSVNFDHSKTNYELSGRHNSPNCKGCHEISNFNKVSKECSSCHIDVHEAKLGNNCLSCHTLNGWEKFDMQEIHFTTEFPFSGRHALIDCISCHKNLPNGNLSTNTTNCVSCHQTDYLNVTDPSHAGSGFSTDCQSCHVHERWKPALFENHDLHFPIFSGEHNRKWDNCSTCHTTPGSYNQFTCLNCHEHNQDEMDSKHFGFTDYSYNSPDCYFCHPTGQAGSFEDHDAVFFPIFSGTHANQWTDCNLCHTNPDNRSEISCLTCHDHNQTDTDQSHGGMNGYSYTTTGCLSCHPTGERGQFVDHDPQFFPIFSGTHLNQWDNCSTCHTNPTSNSEFTCLDCHEHNPTDMNNMHGGMTDYQYQSLSCLTCHPTGQKGQFTEHDLQFFPIYSGEHSGRWTDCATCHTTPSTRTDFSCLGCHEHSQALMDDKHLGQYQGYSYDSPTCLSCHPTGSTEEG